MTRSLSESLQAECLEGRRRRFGWRGTRTGRWSRGGDVEDRKAWEVRALGRLSEYFFRVVGDELNSDDGDLRCGERRVCAITSDGCPGQGIPALNNPSGPGLAREEEI
jgi:hypothetical protein